MTNFALVMRFCVCSCCLKREATSPSSLNPVKNRNKDLPLAKSVKEVQSKQSDGL